MSEEKKYIKITAGALIVNKNGKILLGKGSKWKSRYTIPGGSIQYGEKIADAINRELIEETNLDLSKIKIGPIISVGESVFSKDFHEKKHIIFSDYICEYDGGDDEIQQKEEFDGDFKWFTPEEALKLDLAVDIDNLIKKYIDHENHKDCINNWKRTQADFENYKKDQAKIMGEFRKFASLDMVMQILPVLDNFDASLEHVPGNEKDNSWVTGITYIKKQLEDVLKNNGVNEIEVKLGDKFDPEIHEAVADAGSEGPVKSTEGGPASQVFNRVKKVAQKGYKINGKIIRAAKVIVE